MKSTGSGIDPGSIHVFLQAGNAPETDITSLFAFGSTQGTATVPASSPLAPGTYHLRATVADKAGNQGTASASFAVDTAPPTYTIRTPAANAFLNTSTPAFTVVYQDDSSGVDPAKFALRVDGVDQTRSATAIATGASGTLPALADGTHQIEVTVVDRAGNSAPVVPQSFLVDTVPPTISIASPASGIFTSNNHFPVAVFYVDSGGGIDVTTLKVLIDGVDNTAAFTATATAATGAPATPLADGPHTITVSISDLAGNSATATTSLIVDTIPPQITVTQPAAGGFTNATNVVVIGAVVDASPVTVTVEGTAASVQGANFTSAGITLNAGAVQVIHVVATDAAGNNSSHGGQLPFGESILPSVLQAQNPIPTPVFWYVASSSVGSDTFFLYGVGFGTFYVNKIVFPASGSSQPLTLNIEHSRSINYSVTSKRWDYILVPGTLLPIPIPLPPVTVAKVTGTLAGTDYINIPGPDTNPDMAFGPTTLRFTVDVTLDDPTLSPKHEWIKTFSFAKPAAQEP